MEVKIFEEKVEELSQQNLSLKSKGKEVESILMESANREDTIEIKPLTFQQ